jgi:V-type H+-transporting ATPase subunit E
MMEVNVQMRVRKSDMPLIQEVMPKAIAAYKSKMQSEVKAFNGKEVPLKLEIDVAHPLPEYSAEAGVESCIGGVTIHARKGRIVCANTLDERLQLCYQEAIPEIRGSLFPSIRKNR